MRNDHSHRAHKSGEAARPKRKTRKIDLLCAAATEALEARTMMSQTISGTVTLNGAGQGGVVVYADLNNDGKFETNENNKTTASNGTYSFLSLNAGNYTIRVAPPSGETQASPANNAGISVGVTSGSNHTGVSFNLTKPTSPAVTISGTHLSGTVYGTPGSYQNEGNTISNAVDGNLGTYFDSPVISGGVVALDFGAATVLTGIKYAPRSGWTSRMLGGVFQASNVADFSSGTVTLFTVTSTPAAGSLTSVAISNSTAYRYVRYVGPAGGFCNVAEIQFYGNATSSSSTGSGGSSGSTGGGSTGTGSGSSSTGSTGPAISSGSTGWNTYSAGPSTGTAPRAIMQVLAAAPMVGIAVDTRALNSTLGYGSPIDANYQWNFGDPNGQYNTLPGFNATHIYTVPGSYTITLTVTNALHQSSSVSAVVNIAADSRRPIYVNAASGNDNNNGLTPGSAIQSASRAAALVNNNTEIFFERGQTFNLGSAFKLNFHNVLVGAYGSGKAPVINYTSLAVGAVIFTTNSPVANGVTVQDLTLTTLNGSQPKATNMPMGVMAGGTDIAVLRMNFLYVEYDVNASPSPVGLTVEGCSSPINGGLQGYFVWDEATDTSIIGNYVNGSTHEHVVRTSSATQILAYDNDFNNFDGKGGIEIHVGSYAWIDNNYMNGGDIRVGPLGLWGEPVSDSTFSCVIQNNNVNNTDIQVFPGAHDIAIHNNIITRNQKQLIDVIGEDGLGRQSADIRIVNNTGFLTGPTGDFLKIESRTLDVLLENNLLISSAYQPGEYGTAAVYVYDSSLSADFTYISNNVWAMPATLYSTAHGGVNTIGSAYVDPSTWNSQSVVGTDYFVNASVNSINAPAGGSLASYIGSAVTGVFTNYYGTPRPASGAWTAGAV